MPNVQRKVGFRRWSHKSVLRLLKESGLPGESPEVTITRKARAIVERGEQLGWTGPPFDVHLLATVLGIRTRENSTITAEAQIIPVGGQFELVFRRDVAPTRLNFTFAHEIGHTLFPDCGAMIRERNGSSNTFDPDREVERLCDVAAGQIVMPSPYFEDDLKKLGGDLRIIDALASKYEVSREAVLHRISSAGNSSSALIYFTYGYNRREIESLSKKSLFPNESIQPRLRIGSVFPSGAFQIFLPRNKSIPDNSVLYELLTAKRYVSKNESWNIPNFGTRFVEGIRLYNLDTAERMGIVALIR